MPTYDKRTPESIKTELASYTEENCLQLAKFLQDFMANEHNGRDFVGLAKDTKIGPPSTRMRVILAHAYDWLAYGN